MYYHPVPKKLMTRISEQPPCSRVPVEMFEQDKIWVNSKGITEPIPKIADGHLDNIIRWIGQHQAHWKASKFPILNSPLYRRLLLEQQMRIPKRARTPRAAVKDTLMNDTIIVDQVPHVDAVVEKIISGIRKRGYDVTKISAKSGEKR
jgi:hypothetical protein